MYYMIYVNFSLYFSNNFNNTNRTELDVKYQKGTKDFKKIKKDSKI